MSNQLQCRWCGATGDEEYFETHPDYTEGYWCPNCDGFTRYGWKPDSDITLILERDEKGERLTGHMATPKFKKNLSPLRYPGGKSRMIEQIYSRLGSTHIDCFCEACAGGASVGLSLLEAGVTDRLWINDRDPGVYAFWHVLMDEPSYLISRIHDKEPPTREDFEKEKKRLLSGEGRSVDLAWAQLVVNRLSFSGIAKAGPLGGKNGGKDALLARWNPAALTRKIMQIYDMRDCIRVSCLDVCSLIESYAYWEPNSVLFIDPPYYKKGQTLYPYSFSGDDHRRLADLITNLSTQFPGQRVIITYDDDSFISDLYPTANVEKICRTYSL